MDLIGFLTNAYARVAGYKNNKVPPVRREEVREDSGDYKGFLSAAAASVDSNKKLAEEKWAAAQREDARRAAKKKAYLDSRTRIVVENFQPIFSALSSLPEKDGKRFSIDDVTKWYGGSGGSAYALATFLIKYEDAKTQFRDEAQLIYKGGDEWELRCIDTSASRHWDGRGNFVGNTAEIIKELGDFIGNVAPDRLEELKAALAKSAPSAPPPSPNGP